MRDVTIGNIVQINIEGTCYHEKIGKVVEIVHDDDEDGPIGVEFARTDMADYAPKWEVCVVRFKIDELIILKELPFNIKVRNLFGDTPRLTHELPFKFSPLNYCMSEDCDNKATNRAVTLLSSGVIYEFDVCDTHYKSCNGKWIEEFAISYDYKLVENIPFDN